LNTQAQPKQENPLVKFRDDLDRRIPEYAKVLPPGMSSQQFARTALTAIQYKPQLLRANRDSLFLAIMQAAEDGLLPDGREGALVPYKRKYEASPGNWQDELTVQWLPMVEGMRRLVWESAGIILHTKVVYDRDEFDYQEGLVENPIFHRPRPGPRGIENVTAVYSIAKFPDGRRDWDVLWKEEVDQIAAKSRAGATGPWRDPVFYPEMAVKTVVHHHSKTLPLKSQARQAIERGGDLVEVGPARQPRQVPGDEPVAELTHEPPMPMDTVQTRSVDGLMSAMANGDKVEAPARRRRRTAEEMAQARATAAGASGGNGQSQAGAQGSGAASPDAARVILRDPDGTTYYKDTGEIIQYGEERRSNDHEAAEAKVAEATGSAAPALGANPQHSVMYALRELMDSPQPNNREEYLAWVEAKLEFAVEAYQKEALRQWWEITGGMRTQFGITQADVKALGEKMRRQQPA
jgi:recombination protein RecT